MNKKIAGLSALLPAAVLGGWTIYLSLLTTYGAVVELPVHGYDPRDLLSGHYLTYVVDYGKNVCSPPKGNTERCVCFSQSAPSTGVWAGECREMSSALCTRYLKGRCSYRGFNAGIERYYIPEQFSGTLSQVPNKSTIRVRLNGHGAGVVSEFLVDGMPLLEYAKSKRLASELR